MPPGITEPHRPPTVITLETHKWRGIQLTGADLENCYQGETNEDGKRHGKGCFKYPNKYFEYSGDYVDNIKHGKGSLKLGDGSVYEGDFQNNEITGVGVRTWPDGSRYEGDFVQGERTGEGTLFLPSGDKFTGHFDQNSKEGQGRWMYANGDIFEGNFEHNHPNGLGVFETPAGDKYEGEWLDGKRSGCGTFVASNGDLYEGEWEADLYNGLGHLEDSASGTKVDGRFVNGEVKEPAVALSVLKIFTPLPPPLPPAAPAEGGEGTEGEDQAAAESPFQDPTPPLPDGEEGQEPREPEPVPQPLEVTAGFPIVGHHICIGVHLELVQEEEPLDGTPPGSAPKDVRRGSVAAPGKDGKKDAKKGAPSGLAEMIELDKVGVLADGDSGRLIVGHLHKGWPQRNEETQEIILGEALPDGLLGIRSMRTEDGEGTFEKVEEEPEPEVAKEAEEAETTPPPPQKEDSKKGKKGGGDKDAKAGDKDSRGSTPKTRQGSSKANSREPTPKTDVKAQGGLDMEPTITEAGDEEEKPEEPPPPPKPEVRCLVLQKTLEAGQYTLVLRDETPTHSKLCKETYVVLTVAGNPEELEKAAEAEAREREKAKAKKK